MSQAHGMRLDHPIFHTPNAVDLTLEDIPTPDNYRDWYDGRDLPGTLKAWQVQTRDFPDLDVGLVSDPFGFADLPDAEWISGGVNSKGPNSLALGRHGNFFFWGFFADPKDLTDSARQVFVNTVHYISKYDGQLPLDAREGSSREWALVYAGYVDRDPDAEFVTQLFPPEVLEAVGRDGKALESYYAENLEYLHSKTGEGGFVGYAVDPELKNLGLSNRKPEFLDFLAEQFAADPEDALAAELAGRYGVFRAYWESRTPSRHRDDPPPMDAFLPWLAAHRPALYFADLAGFHWRVNPRAGSPASEPPKPPGN